MAMISNPSGSVVTAVGSIDRSTDAPIETKKKGRKGSDEVVVVVSGEMCRICHLSREICGSNKKSVELIWIGCGCKGELGFAHQDCGEAWFGVRGNRYCEICGMYAKNIIGYGDSSFMEEWLEARMLDDIGNRHSSSERVSCWGGRTFCYFLMGCLVIALVLPWFLSHKIALR